MPVFFAPQLDEIFKFAGGMEKAVRMRNIVFCRGNYVFILNFDRTFILRFDLGKKVFDPQIGFYSDDYDSKKIYEEDGKIVFFQSGGVRYNRRKVCKAPTDVRFEELENIFNRFIEIREKKGKKWQKIIFPKKDLKLLSEKLSHIEFLRNDGELIIRQKDLSSGNIVELVEKPEVRFVFGSKTKVKDFLPVAMRTSDFAYLFGLNNFVTVEVGASDENFFIVRGDSTRRMVGVVASCVYDELGKVKYASESSISKKKEDLDMAHAGGGVVAKGKVKGVKGKVSLTLRGARRAAAKKVAKKKKRA